MLPDGFKVCDSCGEGRPDKPKTRCPGCSRNAQARWRAAHPERRLEQHAKSRAKHVDQTRRKNAEMRERDRAAYNAKIAEWRASNPTAPSSRHLYRNQEATVPLATRSGVEWTGPELEQIANYSKTAQQLAVELGRTFYSVKKARQKLATHPRSIALAGLSEHGTPSATEPQ